MARTRRPVPRVTPAVQTALDEARVRFGPEQYVLSQLVSDAVSELRRNQAINRQTALGVRALIQTLKPEVEKEYARFGQTASQTESILRNDIATLGATADRFKAPAYANLADSRQRLAESLFRVKTGLLTQEADTEKLRAYNNRQAEGAYSESIGKVRGRQQALAGEIGSYVASRSYSIDQDRAKAQLAASKARTDALRQQRTDTRSDAYLDLAKDKFDYQRNKDATAKPKVPKPRLTADKARGVAKQINQIVALMTDYKNAPPRNFTIGRVRQNLLSKYDEVAVNMAMDVVYRGGLSAPNLAVWNRDLKPHLGKLPSRWAGRPHTPRRPPAVNNRPIFGRA